MADDLVRDPYPSEVEFFRRNPKTTGMATQDGKVIINPFSDLSEKQRKAVIKNETARLLMRNDKRYTPVFPLTREQQKTLSSYPGSLQDKRETVVGRIVSGDRSAGTPTEAQLHYARRVNRTLAEGEK